MIAFSGVAQATTAQPHPTTVDAPYRHGIEPMLGHTLTNTSATPAASSNNLAYGGGIDGIGVTTGHEKVYLVFYGSQWGSASTNASGDTTLSGDPDGAAPYLQEFFKGLGTGNETWSGVMTQYCDGVSTGATSCPASDTEHVAYPTGGALAGVWEDTSTASPQTASGHQLALEAISAAAHFGNTTAASNRDTQYDILSPTGTNPDNWTTQGFCAWHDYNGDSTLSGGAASSPYGDIAFTNMPYVADQGSGCGQGFVNSPGTLDGFSIVNGHEYAETITDQNPAGGWTNSGGEENGDLCAWISSGQGASQNLSLTTGTFAVQSTYANDFNSGAGGCEVSHPIVTNPGGGGNTVTVTNPGSKTGTVGTAVSLQISATDSASGQTLTYSAAGLPAGLSISTSGLISGTPTTAGTYTVTATAKDTTGATGSASFTWTISTSGGGGGCTAAQLIGNPGFETGAITPWTSTAGVLNDSSAGEAAHSGSYLAWLDGYGTTHTDTLAQSVTIPSTCKTATFSFWLHIDTAETTTTSTHDTLTVQVLNSGGTVLGTLATFSNLNHNTGYTQHSYSLAPYIGQTVTLKFTGKENSSLQTSFVDDDNALNVN
ncbi:MAG TPA: putative Ig domain-containing protein [Actinocrinis sp.]|nr:putative Ig domain-containing protein [Actinocrinis sp.]